MVNIVRTRVADESGFWPQVLGTVARCASAIAAAAIAATAAGAAQAADWANVVMYHRFGEDAFPSTNIHIEQFEAHLAEVQSGGYNVLALPDIIAALRERRDLPDRTVAITVDDAYLSVYNEAWPRLKAAGLPFTLFVATDPIDRGLAGYMTWEQIRELAQAGVTIGSQTATHPHLPAMPLERVRAELAQSNQRFQEELGEVPTIFAYPYGEFGRAVAGVVAEAGFVAAFGQHSGVAHALSDMYALPRFAMNETYGSLERFKLAANALPLKVTEITPTDTVLSGANPPPFGFTVADDIANLRLLACFASNQPGPTRIERLGERRFEVRLDQAFEPGRGRINCTMPASGNRWRWFGIQFYIPRN